MLSPRLAGLLVGLYFYLGEARSQLVEAPHLSYKKTTFDDLHRGSYDMSDCTRELINCWEIIKSDYICAMWGNEHESVCGALRSHCSDKWGPLDAEYVGGPFPLFTEMCNLAQEYTRRARRAPRHLLH